MKKEAVFKKTLTMAVLGVAIAAHFTFAGVKLPVGVIPVSAAKTVSVGSFEGLKLALEDSEEATVKLTGDVTLSGKITVQGTKKLVGGGYRIKRKATSGSEFKGTMFAVGKVSSYKGTFTLENVTIDGGGDSSTLKDNMQGRMIELFYSGSSLTLNSGTILKKNYNVSSCIDGGGGVTISSGCSMVMNAGSEISDNKTVTGGAAVRVKNGGSFTMKGGELTGNYVYGNADGGDFDGLGGAVHNNGTVSLEGGTISANYAQGYMLSGAKKGGVGGGIYNLGTLQLKGTNISGNSAFSGGGGIYTTGSSTVNMTSGNLASNTSQGETPGGGIYVNNGSQLQFSGGNIYANTAWTGGGIYLSKENSKIVMSGGRIYANKGLSDGSSVGGGIRNNGASMEIKGGSIGLNTSGAVSNNETPNASLPGYSSLLFNSGTITVSNVTISVNKEGCYPIVNSGVMNYYGGSVTGKGLAGILNKKMMVFGESSGNGMPGIASGFIAGVENQDCLIVNRGTLQGVTAALINKNDATITGGTIGSSGEYGIASKGGVTWIQGGTVQGKKYALYGEGGKIKMSKAPDIPTIFLKKGIMVEVPEALTKTGGAMIEPEDYIAGRLLVKATYGEGSAKPVKSMFGLVSYKNFYMYDEGSGLYVGEKNYRIEFGANGGIGKMDSVLAPSGLKIKLPANSFVRKGYQFLGWSFKEVNPGSKKAVEIKDQEEVIDLAEYDNTVLLYAVWCKYPEISVTDDLSFYEDESVSIDTINQYVSAKDEQDGDISKEIKAESIVYANGKTDEKPESLLTSSQYIGQAEITYTVANSNDCESSVVMPLVILANAPPVFSVRDRYYFLKETRDKAEKEKKEMLCEAIHISDDSEDAGELFQNFIMDTEAVNFEEPGEYDVSVFTRDQYGHRFYMEKGEKAQYGKGKEVKETFTVHIIAEQEQKKENGYVRFISKEYMDTFLPESKWRGTELSKRLKGLLQTEPEESKCRQVWFFDKKDIMYAKNYIKGLPDPFSSSANKAFYQVMKSRQCLERG